MKNFVLNYALEQLSLLCLYPDVKNLKFQIIGALVCFFYALAWTLNIIGLFVNFNGLDSIQQAMVSLPSAHQILFKSIFMFFTKDKLVQVVNKMYSLQSFHLHEDNAEHRRINKFKNRFNKCFKIYKKIILITSYIFIFKPLFSPNRRLPIGWYTPCDVNDNFCFILWYISESVYVLFAQYTLATMDSLFFASIFLLYIEITKLKGHFQDMCEERKIGEKLYEKLAKNVDQHNKILEILTDINSVFQYQLLNQFVTTIVTICFGIFYLNSSYPPHLELIPYLLVYHNQLFMYCFAGEMIQRQVNSISLAIYNSEWYSNNHPAFNRCIKLVMQRSQRPIKMNIGRIWKLDMGTFIGVMKTSLSIHTFLQTINKEK